MFFARKHPKTCRELGEHEQLWLEVDELAISDFVMHHHEAHVPGITQTDEELRVVLHSGVGQKVRPVQIAEIEDVELNL